MGQSISRVSAPAFTAFAAPVIEPKPKLASGPWDHQRSSGRKPGAPRSVGGLALTGLAFAATAAAENVTGLKPLALVPRITQANGAVNWTTVDALLDATPPGVLYDAINMASTCRDLTDDDGIEDQPAWLQRCMTSIYRGRQIEVREPSDREKDRMTRARREFAFDFAPFLAAIEARQDTGGAVEPSASVFLPKRWIPDALIPSRVTGGTYMTQVEDTIVKILKFESDPSDEAMRHQLVYAHLHDDMVRWFGDHPGLTGQYMAALTQRVARDSVGDLSTEPLRRKLQLALDLMYRMVTLSTDITVEVAANSDSLAQALIDRAVPAEARRRDPQAGLRFLQNALYLFDDAAIEKLEEAMDVHFKWAVPASVPLLAPGPAQDVALATGAIALAIRFVINKLRDNTQQPVQAVEAEAQQALAAPAADPAPTPTPPLDAQEMRVLRAIASLQPGADDEPPSRRVLKRKLPGNLKGARLQGLEQALVRKGLINESRRLTAAGRAMAETLKTD